MTQEMWTFKDGSSRSDRVNWRQRVIRSVYDDTTHEES